MEGLVLQALDMSQYTACQNLSFPGRACHDHGSYMKKNEDLHNENSRKKTYSYFPKAFLRSWKEITILKTSRLVDLIA